MDLPTTTEAAEAVKTLGGGAGLVWAAKFIGTSIVRGWEHFAAARRSRADASLVEEQAELVNAKTLAATVADLQNRVGALEKALKEERDARERAERERDEERTGKHEALRQATAATTRLELVERDADRRIREALAAVAKSAEERACWERIARQTKAAFEEYEAHVRAGYTNSPPPASRDSIDTEPPSPNASPAKDSTRGRLRK